MIRDGMRYWRLHPHAHLRPWVVCYYYVEPDPVTPAVPISRIERQVILPDGHSEIVFTLAGAFERWRVDAPDCRMKMSAGYLIGGRSHSVHTHTLGSLKLAGIKLHPHALATLTDTPLGEFRDTTLALSELNCKALCDLEEAVAAVRSRSELTRVLDRFLLRALRRLTSPDPIVAALNCHIERSCGSGSVLQWAHEQRIAERTLERRFIAAMGMSPKQFARIVRFKKRYLQFISEVPHGRSKRHLEGYYDQSHFDREFCSFLGVTPAASLAQATTYRTDVSDHLLQSEYAAERVRSAALNLKRSKTRHQ